MCVYIFCFVIVVRITCQLLMFGVPHVTQVFIVAIPGIPRPAQLCIMTISEIVSGIDMGLSCVDVLTQI